MKGRLKSTSAPQLESLPKFVLCLIRDVRIPTFNESPDSGSMLVGASIQIRENAFGPPLRAGVGSSDVGETDFIEVS
jgi:hypothetical protein